MPVRYLKPPRTKYSPQAGDILAFAGAGLVSRIIQHRTLSRFSHVGIVADVPESLWRHEHLAARFPGHPVGKLLFESTTLMDTPCAFQETKVSGPQAIPPAERIQGYQGSVHVMRLRDELRPEQSEALTACLIEYLGREYDTKEAILSGTWLLKLLKFGDSTRLFCSEYVGRGLIAAGKLNYSDPSDWSPARLIRLLMDACIYHRPREIVWREI